MFFNNLFRSFKMGLRILRNTLMRPFRSVYFRMKRSTDITRKIAQKAPRMGKSVRKVKLKPTRREDYVETKTAYVAKSLIVLIVLIVIGLAALFYFILWPLAQGWWFTAKMWQRDEAVPAYSGRVWLYEDEGKSTRVFAGKLAEGKRTGDGVEYYTNGNEKYKGSFQDGLYHGQGAYYNDDNTLIYEGAFQLGIYDGAGKQYDHGVLRYEGGFTAGEWDGKGTLYDEQGNLAYIGGFVRGGMEGEGEFYSGGVLRYKGGVSGGEYAGTGKEYHADGRTVAYSGTFLGGQRSGYGVAYDERGQVRYQGNFDVGQYSGEGSLFYPNGQLHYNGGFLLGEFSIEGVLYGEDGARLYKGGFERGQYNGEGTLFSAEGETLYEGGFVDGVYHGQGKLRLDGRRRMEGTFAKGQFSGVGKLFVSELLYYEGEFRDYMMHGEGKRYASDGRVIFQGRFRNGGVDGVPLMDMPLEEARKSFAEANTADVETEIGLLVKNIDLRVALFANYQTKDQEPIIHRVYQYDWSAVALACEKYPPPEEGLSYSRASATVENLLAEPLPALGYGASVTMPGCFLHIWSVNGASGISLSRYMSKTPLPLNGIPPSKIAEIELDGQTLEEWFKEQEEGEDGEDKADAATATNVARAPNAANATNEGKAQ